MKIHAIAFVDISYSWGPAIHFVELWNEYAKLSDREVIGHAVLERNDRPYNQLEFKLHPFNLMGNSNPIKRRAFKLLYDAELFFKFLLLARSIVYIRQSRFGLLLLIALLMRRHEVFVEMNGLAAEDQLNSMLRRSRIRVWFYRFMEWLYMRLPNLTVISVAPTLTKTIKERYHTKHAFTVRNGCSDRLVQPYEEKRPAGKDVLNIGFLGTFTSWDGHEKTGELYRAVKKSGKKVLFHIAGPGVKETVIYREFEGNPDFRFYDTVPYTKLKDFYSVLDAAFAFDRIDRSKTVEQSTLKIIEYWASKLPIVATKARGNEFIEEYGIGYLMEENEMRDPQRFQEAVGIFLGSLVEYARNYARAPLPRTWRDVAEDTDRIVESRITI